ncbi:hypothetical protein Tco_0521168 [Tanacetum coccineum]
MTNSLRAIMEEHQASMESYKKVHNETVRSELRMDMVQQNCFKQSAKEYLSKTEGNPTSSEEDGTDSLRAQGEDDWQPTSETDLQDIQALLNYKRNRLEFHSTMILVLRLEPNVLSGLLFEQRMTLDSGIRVINILKQFMILMGGNITWAMYREAILLRFGLAYDDLLTEIKKLKLVVENALLPTPRYNYTNNSVVNIPKPMSLPVPNANWRNKASTSTSNPQRKQLTQKELEEKRAKNLCFYCDEKIQPGHKCSNQVFLLEFIIDQEGENEIRNELEECLGEEIVWEQEPVVIDQEISPHISLNAFTRVYNYQTMRVIGYVGSVTNAEETFVVETDALGMGIRAVLQENQYPIAFISKTLAPKHNPYKPMKKSFWL